MIKGNSAPLPDEFVNGPWITAQEVMDWLCIKKECLKIGRARAVLAYSKIGGVTMYNKPWIIQKLKDGWRGG